MKKIYFLEGDIGAGKTELINKLKDRGYDIKLEPVNIYKIMDYLKRFIEIQKNMLY